MVKPLLTTYHLPLITYRLPLTAYRLPLTTHYSPKAMSIGKTLKALSRRQNAVVAVVVSIAPSEYSHSRYSLVSVAIVGIAVLVSMQHAPVSAKQQVLHIQAVGQWQVNVLH